MDNFEDVLNQHKEKARKVYAESGESNLIHSAMREIESNCADYEYYFQMGQQSKQKQIDELQARVGAVCSVLDGLKKARYMHSENKKYNSILIEKLEQALKGGEV